MNFKCESCHGTGKLLFDLVPTVHTCEKCEGEGYRELTTRHERILSWRSYGKDVSMISDILSISKSTVQKEEITIQSIMNCKTIIHAVSEAIRKGIIT